MSLRPLPRQGSRPTALEQSPSLALPEIIDPQLKRLDFKNGAPIVPVRLMEGNTEVTLASKGRLRFRVSSDSVEKVVEGPGGQRVASEVGSQVSRGRDAHGSYSNHRNTLQRQSGPCRPPNRSGARQGLVKTRSQILGGVYGIAGKVIDNRRYLTACRRPARSSGSRSASRQAEMLTKYQVRTTLLEDGEAKADCGRCSCSTVSGNVVAQFSHRLAHRRVGRRRAPIEVRRVEYGVGLRLSQLRRPQLSRLDADCGRSLRANLAVINLVGMEDSAQRLSALGDFRQSAHQEALKAQAVTARGEVLAKIGLKHTADPYFLCS